MRKKLCFLAAAVLLFTGCSYNVPDLSRVDNDLAAQYVADALLRSDKYYEGGLEYDHSILNPTPAPTKAPGAQVNNNQKPADGGDTQNSPGGQGTSLNGDGGKSQQPLQSVSLSEIYGIGGVKIKGNAYRVTSSYGTAYAVCTARKGYKLIAVNFSVSNTGNSPKKVDLEKQQVQAELLVNGESAGNPLMSIVDGDLQYFNATIGAGQSKQGVLIFEIEKSKKVHKVEVRFVNGGKEAVVQAS